jgi:putative ABC transport system permease protein
LRYERSAEGGTFVRFASACPAAAPILRERFPEIEKIARVFRHRAVISYEDRKFKENRMYYAEPDFPGLFNVMFIEGNKNALQEGSGKAALSVSTARKYFGEEDPIGKRISLDKEEDFIVAAVFQDFPENSHIKCDILLSYQNLVASRGQELQESWGHTMFFTYLLLNPGADYKALEAKFPAVVEEQAGELMDYFGVKIFLQLQPLYDIHLTSHFMQELEANGNAETLSYLFIIAVFIMVMAWVNYINLSTAQALNRAREVGIRKVIGASRRQLIIQFFWETILMNLIAVIAAITLCELFLSKFHQFTGLPETLQILNQAYFWQFVFYLFIGGVFLSGLYPVLLLSSYQPHKVLKGKLGTNQKRFGLRRALVLFQYLMALLLIVGTITVYQQIEYMRNQPLGFNMEQTLVIKAPRVVAGTMDDRFESFKIETGRLPNVQKSSFCTEVPGRQILWDNGAIHKAGDDPSSGKNYQIVGVDYDYKDFFELEMVTGRNFSREFPSDKEALILNEKAVEWMGFDSSEDAVGKAVDYWGEIYPIIGVMRNFHQQSLKEEFEPHIYRFMASSPRGVFVLKMSSSNMQETITNIQSLWEKMFQGNPFDFFFLDDYYNQQYEADELFGKIFGLFSVMAIFITALGILGLTAFSAIQRSKEVGIRKVLGAGILDILYLMVKDFLGLLIIAFIISIPLAFYGIRWWLEGYAFKMSLNFVVFLISLVVVGSITLITVFTQSFRAATINPVKAIRYE